MFKFKRKYQFYVMGRCLYFADHDNRIAHKFEGGKWEEVNYVFYIMDTIFGYDPDAPDGFKLYNTDIMDMIAEITYEDALQEFGEKPISKITKLFPEKVKNIIEEEKLDV